MKEIVVIGAGAAGQVAAITAKREDPESRVIIVEKNPLPGKKLRATGNGRCNMTNTGCPDAREVLTFFETLGVMTTVDEEGRIYPYSRSAADVQKALITGMEQMSVEIMTDTGVTGISERADGKGYAVSTESGRRAGSLICDRVLIACGGKAGPRFGTTGDGYKWARELGHSVTRLAPCLTGVRVKEDTSDLAGVRARGRVTLLKAGSPVFQEDGEIQFTDYGLSGICVFNMTRHMTVPEGMDLKEGMAGYLVSIDFFPETDDMAAVLREREKLQGLTGPDRLVSMLKEPVRERVYKESGEDMVRMAELLKSMTFVPLMPMGWGHAQVTKGGVPYSEVDESTMESRYAPGVFFAGEIMDYDGPCGGFNLQHAFHTGMTAGKALVR